MKLKSLHEDSFGDTAIDVGLDAAGLIPGIGEGADLLNALRHIKRKDYLSAAFSLISMVPEVGDAVGKGVKYLAKANKYSGGGIGKIATKFMAKHGDDIAKLWPKVVKLVKHSNQLRTKLDKHMPKLDRALRDAIHSKDGAQSDIPGNQQSPLASHHRSTGAGQATH